MNEREFKIEAPPVPEHFIEARERALGLIQCGEAYATRRRRSLLRETVLVVIAALLLTMGAAAAVNSFGILNFLNWSSMSMPKGAEETFVTDLGKVEGELYTASVEEAYFDGINFMLVVCYDVKNPQDALFVNELKGYWCDDEGFYRVGQVWELGGPEDPWQTLSEYEDQHGGTRARISAIEPSMFIDAASWGSSGYAFHQADGSLIHVLQGTLDQPAKGPVTISIRSGAVPAGTERLTEYEGMSVTLRASETAWQAEYVPEAEGEGWKIESLRITAGRMLMQAEIEYFCRQGLMGEHDYGNIVIMDADGNEIPMPGGGGGETTLLPDGSFRSKESLTLLTPDGRPDVLWLYLERDGALTLGPIECRLAE